MPAAPRFALAIDAIFADLLGDVLNQHGHALGGAGESTPHGGNDAIDVAGPRTEANLQFLIGARFAGFRDMPHHPIEAPRDDFVDAQVDQTSVGRDLSEV